MRSPPDVRRAAGEAAPQNTTAKHQPRHLTTPRVRHARRRLPPYATKCVVARKAGLAPAGWLWIQRSWPERPPGLWTIVVPGDEDPAQYDFGLCRGLACYVSCSSGDRANAVLISLIQAANPAIGAVIIDGEFHLWI